MGQFSGHVMRTTWFRVYRERMTRGLEHCRNCNITGAQTFDHVTPRAVGGTSSFDNVTILCIECNHEKDENIWPHLISLADEEAMAPSDQQWYTRAKDKAAYVDIESAISRLRARFSPAI